jgi:hypothetical protein
VTLTYLTLFLSGFAVLLCLCLYLIVRFPRFAAWLERLVDGG